MHVILKQWKSKGLKKIILNKFGLYFLKFRVGSDLQENLNVGHTYVGENCMKIAKWQERMDLNSWPLESAQIWVSFTDIPPHMHSANALSHL